MGSNRTYAAYIHLPAGLVAPKPKNISFEQAAALPTLASPHYRFSTEQQLIRKTIFSNRRVRGRLFVLKLLLANGIKNIVATAGSMSSIEKLHQLGLQKTASSIIEKNLTEIIKRRSNQQGINVAIDAVGQHLGSCLQY
jgi:NADPH:quinone reductase-like Zn-dependent oxidoreductase